MAKRGRFYQEAIDQVSLEGAGYLVRLMDTSIKTRRGWDCCALPTNLETNMSISPWNYQQVRDNEKVLGEAPKPPTKPPKEHGRFFIPKGTVVSICKTTDLHKHWKRYVTKKDLHFERYDLVRSGTYTFRFENWFLLVSKTKVVPLLRPHRNVYL